MWKEYPAHTQLCVITTAKSRPEPCPRERFFAGQTPGDGLPALFSGLSRQVHTRYEWSLGFFAEAATWPFPCVRRNVHGSEDDIPRFLHRPGHAVQEWLAGRSGLPRLGGLADRRRNPWPRAGGDHGRESDAQS